jgi:hypothetical protein
MSITYKAVAASASPALAGGRHALPQRTVFAIGKLTKGTRDHVCRVRNISDGGVGIQHDAGLEVGDEVTIEMRGLDPSPAIVRWVEELRAGLAFLTPVSVEAVSEDVGRADGRILRSPRFAVAQDALLEVEDRQIAARVVDLALGGMRIEAPCDDLAGKPATIIMTRAERTLKGRICWTSGTAAGIRFAVPLASQDLAALVADEGQTMHA